MKLFLIGFMSLTLMACNQQNSEIAAKQIETDDIKGCNKDLKICPDGQSVGRDIHNQCEFIACPAPPEVSACPDDVKQCPDGSFVPRDQSKFCEFKACPEDNTKVEESVEPASANLGAKACSKDLKMCPDGHGVGRDPLNNCEFHACASAVVKKGEPMLCTQDVKQCPDGSFVGRDSNKNCAFKPCPEGGNSK